MPVQVRSITHAEVMTSRQSLASYRPLETDFRLTSSIAGFSINAQFFQSWRGALLVAAVVTVGVSGYKAIFGPDTATRIAQARMSRLLPGG